MVKTKYLGILILLVALLIVIPAVSGYQQDFQNYDGGMATSYTSLTCGGTISACTLYGFSPAISGSGSPYEEVIRYHGSYNFNAYGPGVVTYSFSQYIFYDQPQAATNFSYVMSTMSSGGGSVTENRYPQVVLKSAAGATLATLTAPSGIDTSYHRISIQIIGTSVKMFIDGKYQTSATVATNPSYFYAGVYVSGSNSGSAMNRYNYVYIDDYIVNPTPAAEFNIAEAIPQNWTVIIDDINPANNGLYNAAGALDNSNTFYDRFSKVSNTSQTWQIQNFLTGTVVESLKTANECTGRIGNNVSALIGRPTGLYRTFIDETGSSSYFWVTRYGATATWDNPVYDLEDTAILSYSITGGYWDTANYDYEVDVISEAGAEIASQSISAASGSKYFPITEALYTPGGIYYGVVNAVNKSTSENTYMAYDIMTVNDEVSLQGYVMNATDGSPVSGALVTVMQTDGTRVSTTSGTTGIYNVTGIHDNYQLWFNTSATGYWADNHTFMPYTVKGYNVNISMIPKTIAVSGAALIGRTYEKPYFNAVPGATLLATNTTHGLSNTTTSNIAGGYFFDGLPAAELMSDYGSLSGYVPDQYPYRINTSASGSYVIQDVNFSTSYNLGLTFRDATTHALILSSVTVEYSGAKTGTTTTTTGTANISSSYGILTVIVSAENYYGATDSYLMDTDRTDTIYLTAAESTTANTNTIYSPKTIGITVVRRSPAGIHVANAPIELRAIGSTLPTITTEGESLQTIYGVDPEAANLLLNNTLIMSGTTGGDGSTGFTVLSTIGYNVSVTDPADGTIWYSNLYPSDPTGLYSIWIGENPITAAANTIQSGLNNTRLWITEPDPGNITLNMRYQDVSGATSNVIFRVIAAANDTVIYSVDLGDPDTRLVYANYTVPNVRGVSYYAGYNATRVT